MTILQQLHTFDHPSVDPESTDVLTAAQEELIVSIAKKAVGRAYRYHGIRKEQQTLLWDEIVQEALMGVYEALGRTVKTAYQSAVWCALRFLHQQENNPDGIFNQPRVHESYEQMVETMAGGEYSWTKTNIRRPTESEAFYNIERVDRTWQGSRVYWENLQAQTVMEMAAATYNASDEQDMIWHKVHDDLFAAFCEQRQSHQLKPISLYSYIVIQRSRGVTHEEIFATLDLNDPIRYMNLVNFAFQALEELAEMTPAERTERMAVNHGLILHHAALKEDMSPLLSDAHNKHIVIFPFGALSMTKKINKPKTARELVGKFEMQYFSGGDWKTGKRRKVSVTTPPLAGLTYSQLRETALRFIDRVRTAGGDEVAHEFFGPAVLHSLLNA